MTATEEQRCHYLFIIKKKHISQENDVLYKTTEQAYEKPEHRHF